MRGYPAHLKAQNLAHKISRTARHLSNTGIVRLPLPFDAELERFTQRAMVEGIGEDVLRTIRFLKKCDDAQIDTGRRYWCYRNRSGELIGLAGYHHRQWDPAHVVWGGWYVCAANQPALAKMGMLLEVLRTLSVETNYEVLYVEALADARASNILDIYRALMLDEITRVEDFYGPGVDMALMKLELAPLRAYMTSDATAAAV